METRILPEKKLNSYFDVLAGFQFVENHYGEGLKSYEKRYILGGKLHFSPHSRIESGFYPRFEFRYFKTENSVDWLYSPRLRLRFFANIPIYYKANSGENICYILTNVEWFIPFHENFKVDLTYQIGMWLGVGYKLNQRLKTEIIYNMQETINSDELNHIPRMNIIRIIFRHSLN